MLFGFAHAELSVDMPKRRRYVVSSREEVRPEVWTGPDTIWRLEIGSIVDGLAR